MEKNKKTKKEIKKSEEEKIETPVKETEVKTEVKMEEEAKKVTEEMLEKADKEDSPTDKDLVKDENAHLKNKNHKREQDIEIEFDMDTWNPKTEIGKKVKAGEIKTIKEVLEQGKTLRDVKVIDAVAPGLKRELLIIGQAKGKFGGGQGRAFRQTQKKTKEGNVPSFKTLAIVGNEDGYIGMGMGKSKETMPAREKAVKNAKLNIIHVPRGCGSWQCSCGTPHSIPFKVEGKCSSAKIRLIPAPKGTGLVIQEECKKMMKMAGIKDIRSKTFGTLTKENLIVACFEALKNLSKMKVQTEHKKILGIKDAE